WNLEVLVRKYHRRVWRTAYAILEDPSLAKDAEQQVFLNLRKPGHPPPEEFIKNPEAFLHRAATNAALDIVKERKRRREREVSLESIPEAAVPAQPQLSERDQALYEGLQQMDPEILEVLILRRYENYIWPNIAAKTGKSQAKVIRLLLKGDKILEQ